MDALRHGGLRQASSFCKLASSLAGQQLTLRQAVRNTPRGQRRPTVEAVIDSGGGQKQLDRLDPQASQVQAVVPPRPFLSLSEEGSLWRIFLALPWDDGLSGSSDASPGFHPSRRLLLCCIFCLLLRASLASFWEAELAHGCTR